MEHRLEHDFDVSPDQLWERYLLDRDFLMDAYTKLRLTLEHFEVSEQGSGATRVIERMIQISPQREMPSFLKKLVGGSACVTQFERYDAAKQEVTLQVQIPVIGDRVEYGARYTWTILPSGGTRRRWEGRCRAKIPFIGRKIETYFLDEMTRGVEEMYPLLVASFR